jgi:two-component system chemotaxis response regulator CheY
VPVFRLRETCVRKRRTIGNHPSSNTIHESENCGDFARAGQSEETMKTCLIVDDSSVIRKVARRILEGLEFQIVEAENGEDAIETCQRDLPDAILLDWNMPKMDGYEFLRLLRRLPGGDKPKVVFCTTENDVAHIARALHAGANEYIMKPFDRDIVEAKFQEVGLI